MASKSGGKALQRLPSLGAVAEQSDLSKLVSSSFPTVPATRVAVLKRRRVKTKDIPYYVATTPLSSGNSPSEFRAAVFNELKDRMEKCNIDTANLSEATLCFCLPKNTANRDDWAAFLENPLLVPDDQLARMMHLHPSDQDTPRPPPDTTIYYVRSFCLLVRELYDILSRMETEGKGYIKAGTWKTLTEDLAQEDVVFIRYCGMTASRSAYSRHRDDLSGGEGAAKSKFLQAMADMYPEAVHGAAIFELPEAMIDFPVDSIVTDTREQALIAAFHLDSLLNTQKGGKWASYTPVGGDELTFLSLRARLSASLPGMTIECTEDTKAQIQKIFEEIQEYAHDHPISTNTVTSGYSNEYRDLAAKQAQAAVLNNGNSILLSIAMDIPMQGFLHPEYFYSGQLRTSHAVTSIINHMAYWEKDLFSELDSGAIINLRDQGMLPFWDVYPWPRKDATDFATVLGWMIQYLNVTKPLIILSYSEWTTKIVMSSFAHKHGLRDGAFGKMVGGIYMSSFPDVAGGPSTPVLVIPCYHPGAVYHNSGGSEVFGTFYAVLSRTLWIAWLAMAEAVRLSKSYLDRHELCEKIMAAVEEKTGPGTQFYVTLEAEWLKLQSFWAKVDRSRTDIDPTKKISDAAAAANAEKYIDPTSTTTTIYKKAELKPAVSPKGAGRRTRTQDVLISESPFANDASRWRMARDELEMVLLCGYATGISKLKEQQLEAQKLFGLSIGPLMTDSVPHKEDEFVEWARSVPTGNSYYFAAAELEDQLADIPNLVSTHLTSDISDHNDAEWKADESVCKAASADLQSWVSAIMKKPSASVTEATYDSYLAIHEVLEKRAPDLALALRQDARAQPALEFLDANTNLNGHQIRVIPLVGHKRGTDGAYLRLEWNDTAGKRHSIRRLMLPNGVLPTFADDARLIYFVHEGVDIRNANGTSLGSNSISRLVTMPLAGLTLALQGHVEKDAFFELWQQQTGESFEDALFTDRDPAQQTSTADKIYPKSFFAGRSEGLDTGARKSAATRVLRMQALLPLQPGDALWLLDRFLTQHYPQGGEINACNPATFPAADSVWTKLTSFLADQKYRHHPHLIALRAVCESARDQRRGGACVTALGAALVILRPPVTTKHVMRPTGPRGKRLRQTRFTVAANLPANTVEVRATPEAAEVRASPDLVEEVTVDAEDDDGAAVAEETMKQLLSDDQEGEAELEDVEQVEDTDMSQSTHAVGVASQASALGDNNGTGEATAATGLVDDEEEDSDGNVPVMAPPRKRPRRS